MSINASLVNHLVIPQKLLFILGKGGVGRTSYAASLAKSFSDKGEKVLVVQWSFTDSICPHLSEPPCEHSAVKTSLGFYTMNYNVNHAIREYFVDHLKMNLLYSVVIENKHVQKLIHAAPGIAELFFLGRLFWLVELSQQERGSCYDRVIVDSPATGHGSSLFGLAEAIAKLGVTGPLANECDRVMKLLRNPKKTAVFFVTLAEELPVEETIEFIPKLSLQIQHDAISIVVNQSVYLNNLLNLEEMVSSNCFHGLENILYSTSAHVECLNIYHSLFKQRKYEERLYLWAQEEKKNIFFLPDLNFCSNNLSFFHRIEYLAHLIKINL